MKLKNLLHLKTAVIAIALLFFLGFVNFDYALAGEEDTLPIVKCETDSNTAACDFCQAFTLISRSVTFILYYVIPPLTVISFLYAGFFFLVSGSDPNYRTKGRKIITVTITGIIIAFSSWIVINTIISQLVDEDSGLFWKPWNAMPTCDAEGMQAPPAQIKNACNDGQDNDGDKLIDFKGLDKNSDGDFTDEGEAEKDPDCTSEADNNEKKEEEEGFKGQPECEADNISLEIENIISCMKDKGFTKPSPNQINRGGHKCEPPSKVSCHYGGPNTKNGCNGTSHAVDYSMRLAPKNIKGLQEIKDALNSCAGVAAAFCEDARGSRTQGCGGDANHVHAIDTQAGSCGCN